MNKKPLLNIYKINLKIKPYEKLLIFTDTVRDDESISSDELKRRQSLKEICSILREIGKNLCKKVLYFEYPSLGAHGVEPPEELWRIAFGDKAVKEIEKLGLLEKLMTKTISKKEIAEVKKVLIKYKNHAVNAVIALSNFSTSHTNFRDLLTKVCGTRYASMPLFDPSMLDGAMDADWKAIHKRAIRIRKLIEPASKIEIFTPNGTEVTILKGKRKVHIDTGILTRKGAFGNLPAGELFFAPIEETAEGTLVIEWAPTRKLASPLILKVEKGKVVSIEGNEPYRKELESKLEISQQNRNIAELGIGINDKAKKPDNILESEKILGTVHIALGDNSSFGGKVRTAFHQDFIFFNPTVYLINDKQKKTKLLENGKFVV